MKFLDVLKNQNKQLTPESTGAVPISINTYTNATFDKSILEMDTVLSSIDAIAKHVAKIKLQAVMKKGESVTIQDNTSDVAKVLKKPNKYMTPYDFLYKVTALLLCSENCFIYPERDSDGNLLSLWPINYEQFQLVRSDSGTLFARFRLNYFKTYTCPYDELIHLRQHWIKDDLMGSANDALKPVCAIIEAQNNGIVSGIKNSAIIRGILKSAGVIKEADLRKARAQFIEDNMSASNNGGVIVVDGKFDYKQIESKPYIVDADTIKAVSDKVYSYFHVTKEFVQSDYTSEKYESVYKGVIEPLAILITQALTAGLYTSRERGYGNEVIASMENVKYQPMSVIVEVLKSTAQLGLFTRDEYREMLGYAPLGADSGGNDIMIAVNNYQKEGTNNNE